MNWVAEYIKESLPTIWSRRVATATATIATSSVFLPEYLQKINLSIEGTETLSFRLSVVSTILFLGTLSTLALVVRAYNNKSTQLSEKNKNDTVKKIYSEPIDRTRENILVFLSENDSFTKKQISNALEINLVLVTFHLNKLLEYEFVLSTPETDAWSVTQDGVAYLVRWGLL